MTQEWLDNAMLTGCNTCEHLKYFHKNKVFSPTCLKCKTGEHRIPAQDKIDELLAEIKNRKDK